MLEKYKSSPEEMGVSKEEMLTDEQRERQLASRQIKKRNMIKDSRDESQDQWEIRAKARNKYRDIVQKIFGADKISAEDVAIEMAINMDEEIKELLECGEAKNIAEAIGIVNQEREFQPKAEDEIKKEEYLHRDILGICNALEKNQFSGATARIFYMQVKKGADYKTRKKALRDIIRPLIGKKIVEVVKNKNGKKFVDAFRPAIANCNILDEIKLKELGLSQEELRAPEILEAIKTNLVNTLKESRGRFQNLRWNIIEAGIVSEEEIDGWPEIIEEKNRYRR